MSSTLRLSRRRAEAFIRGISAETVADAVAVREAALRAHSMAVSADSRVLEAEALLQLGRSYSPALEPQSMLVSLQRAEKIFRVNGLLIQAVNCRVASARALLDFGQERNAIAVANNVLVEVSLPIEQRVGAYLVSALSHGQLGELDEAVRLIGQFALPLAEQGGGEALLPHVKRALAITYARVFVLKRYPHLWQGLPELPKVDVDVPKAYYVLALLDDAIAAFPSGIGPNYADVVRQFVIGLSGSAEGAIGELKRLAVDSISRDPHVACWALYCRGLVLRHSGQRLPALDSLADVERLAQRWGLTQILRQATLQSALTKEEVGDFSGSLHAYKAFSVMRLRSLTCSVDSSSVTADPGFAEGGGPAGHEEGTRRLRNLESRHVKKALRPLRRTCARQCLSMTSFHNAGWVGGHSKSRSRRANRAPSRSTSNAASWNSPRFHCAAPTRLSRRSRGPSATNGRLRSPATSSLSTAPSLPLGGRRTTLNSGGAELFLGNAGFHATSFVRKTTIRLRGSSLPRYFDIWARLLSYSGPLDRVRHSLGFRLLARFPYLPVVERCGLKRQVTQGMRRSSAHIFGAQQMLKKVSVSQLRVGMYFARVEGSWLDHGLWKSQFEISDLARLSAVRNSGIRECWIDTAKGKDLDELEAAARTPKTDSADSPALEPSSSKLGFDKVVSAEVTLESETPRAARICKDAREVVSAVFDQARAGEALQLEAVRPVVEEVVASVFRRSGALLAIARLKTQDDYTYMHSVSVCVLMASLGREMGYDHAWCVEAGEAGMLHDVGKAFIPADILNKPGKLTDQEFELIKTHPIQGHQALLDGGMNSTAALEVCRHHHEKVDGWGYPDRLSHEGLSTVVRMSAVCDVYDAVTSDRSYKKAWDPANALSEMAAWKGHFDRATLAAFIRAIGVYPAGSLVRLNSGRLAVVVEHRPHAIRSPVVRTFFSTRSNTPLAVETVDLSVSGATDKILKMERKEDWNFPYLDKLCAN